VVHIAVSVLKQTENSQFQDVVELLGVSQKITRCLQKIPTTNTHIAVARCVIKDDDWNNVKRNEKE
jgi:hypothetical protein